MSVAEKLGSKVDTGFAIAFLQKMIQHKSYSQTEGERELVDWMGEQMRALGLKSDVVPFDGKRANAIGRWVGEGGGKSLMFNGHLDTNPVSEGWTVGPWEGKVDDKFIYGIGVSNMKAGDAAYFCAVKTLIEAGVRLRGDVLLTYVVGELQGGVGTMAMIEQGYRADYFVNSEPTDLQALTMHAGSFVFVIELIGKTRHLSKREEAVDAIAAACDLVPRLNGMKFSGAASPEHEKINRVNVGVIHGALGKDLHEWRPPQVADYVRLRGSGRYAPGQTEGNCLEDMRRVLHELEERFPGLKATVTNEKLNGRLSMPTFEVDRKSPIVKATNNAYRAVRGAEQNTGALTPPGFYGTDAGHLYRVAGMAGIVCGPGGRYNTMPDERVDIDDYLDMIRIYMGIICEICA
ncbi:M20/M25/M40 family metallo-hydrolase [Bosea sp. (in: a-proteobacteria)]|uniref:M20 family metallopeptidase n=1 Tax=Bosea sp. (in: a-proteobacteria) TaxID=1871050 RepID=UPI0026363D72|nr:M20/M25/M40 family metallo-hydrolase [Bosea sp. (in: a-proteobacteria)]MCO5089571.1 M20/M25/M40 family metallo-hydrolase [Bosea sp. (in: a-proteobacteria)]